MIDIASLSRSFHAQFGKEPEWFARAPGRVNIIGEHTDYNGGLMLPAAIDRETAVAARLSPGDSLRIWSMNFEQEVELPTGVPSPPGLLRGWPRYAAAVVAQFIDRGITIPPMEILLEGDIPRASGLSSSASLEVCLATLFNAVTGAGLDPMQVALLSQAAEHSPLVGVKCGIMDQAASALSQTDHALLLDAHTLETQHIPFPAGDAAILIIDTKKRRGLVDSEYNRRREECSEALAEMNRLGNESWETLSHVPEEESRKLLPQIDEVQRRRARHVISENARVRALADAMRARRIEQFAPLLAASHLSLRDDFEVSCHELDVAVEVAMEQPGCLGARMTGAGFGGCAVALFSPGHIPTATEGITSDYERRVGIKPECLATSPAAGAEAHKLA